MNAHNGQQKTNLMRKEERIFEVQIHNVFLVWFTLAKMVLELPAIFRNN